MTGRQAPHTFTSGGAQVLGLNIKDLPTDSADEAQILAFSRQANIERIPLNPGIICKEAIKLIRSTLPATISISQKIDTTICLILADPTQLHQILMNLCTNAYHAMEQTGGILEIVLTNYELSHDELQNHPERHPGAFVMLSVRDSGQGISPEIKDKIFEPYFTTKEQGKGTGMGLAIIHGIVESYGGFITCETEFGKGTVFKIYFPAINQQKVIDDKAVEQTSNGKNEHILLVDDEDMLADLGKSMLESLGYRVTTRTNSLDALATFHDNPDLFDTVITDQTMPGMTGLKLARRILEIRANIPIILCTGYSNIVDEKRAKECGIKEFVMKPMTKNDIATALRKVLDQN